MDYSDFIVMLARQRSGTNALRSVLNSHPDVFCLNEVFNINDRTSDDRIKRETNFFNFLVQYANGDVTRIFPGQHEQIFQDYLAHLRGFTSKRFILIDAKYNTMHCLTTPFVRPQPYLFQLIRKFGLRVLHLTRRNYLRCLLSMLKVETSGVILWCPGSRRLGYSDQQIAVNVRTLLARLRAYDAEDRLVTRYLHDYEKFFSCDYEQVFSGKVGSVESRIEVELVYSDPRASEVTCVWGLNNWSSLPDTFPSGTFLTHDGTHLNTPMLRQGESFVVAFEVEAGTKLDYSFTISRTASGQSAESSRNDPNGRDAHTHVCTVENANEIIDRSHPKESVEVTTTAVPRRWKDVFARTSRARARVRYRNPNAGEVELVWASNRKLCVEKLPAGTFETRGGTRMSTPMIRRDGAFVTELELESNSTLDYGFMITRTADGEPAQIWRIDTNMRAEYRTVVSVADAATSPGIASPATEAPRNGSKVMPCRAVGSNGVAAASGNEHGGHVLQADRATQQESIRLYTKALLLPRLGVSMSFLEKLSDWIGIGNDFQTNSPFRKQSSLPLCDTIENYNEVVAAIRGTEFEYCLEDEATYARPSKLKH